MENKTGPAQHDCNILTKTKTVQSIFKWPYLFHSQRYSRTNLRNILISVSQVCFSLCLFGTSKVVHNNHKRLLHHWEFKRQVCFPFSNCHSFELLECFLCWINAMYAWQSENNNRISSCIDIDNHQLIRYTTPVELHDLFLVSCSQECTLK